VIHDPPALPDTDDQELARFSAMLAIRSIPEPEEAVRWIKQECLIALGSAVPARGAWRVARGMSDLEPELRACGLIEARGPYLTAFGLSVRRYVKENGI
jgi:hypothetical protein